MLYTIYAIQSLLDGRIYVGFTDNIIRRLKEHNAGKTTSTKGYRPWELIYSEFANDRIAARNREKYLKGGSGKEFLKTWRRSSTDTCLPAGRE